MNKIFTAAIAIAATAGLACAEIATAPAGYIERDGDGTLVCNPFYSFDNGATTRLADLDGSNLGIGDTIAIVTPDGTMTLYTWNGSAWSGNPEILRGDAIVLSATKNKSLVVSGLLTNATVDAKSATDIGYKLVGNASAVSKSLSAFSVGGDYDHKYDYVQLRGTKYIYNNGWKVRETGAAPETMPQVASGEGLFLYCGSTRARKAKVKAGTFNVTISVPDDR